MIDFLNSIQGKLSSVAPLKYVDEDWGQLDDYSAYPPVQWPCCLIDVNAVQYSNIGMDRAATPIQRQEGTAAISFTFANLRVTNSSARAPKRQQEQAWKLLEIIQQAHEVLQGFRPEENSGVLVRSAFSRVKRDDGIQQYRVTYSLGMHNV